MDKYLNTNLPITKTSWNILKPNSIHNIFDEVPNHEFLKLQVIKNKQIHKYYFHKLSRSLNK